MPRMKEWTEESSAAHPKMMLFEGSWARFSARLRPPSHVADVKIKSPHSKPQQQSQCHNYS
jgi:hypothetical protein